MLRTPADRHPSSSPPPQARTPSSGVKLVDGTSDLPSEAPFKATQRMGVPESVRLLRIAVPTPMQPITPLLPLSAIEPRPFQRTTARSKLEEARNAALLFFVLVGGCALAACLVVAAIFP